MCCICAGRMWHAYCTFYERAARTHHSTKFMSKLPEHGTMLLREILEKKGKHVHTVSPTASVDAVVQELVRLNIGSLLVRDFPDGPIPGIITECDILRDLGRRMPLEQARELITGQPHHGGNAADDYSSRSPCAGSSRQRALRNRFNWRRGDGAPRRIGAGERFDASLHSGRKRGCDAADLNNRKGYEQSAKPGIVDRRLSYGNSSEQVTDPLINEIGPIVDMFRRSRPALSHVLRAL
jgi:hypothetical protein